MAWEPIVEEIQLPAPMKSGPAPAGALFARLAHEPGSFFLDSSLTHPVLGRYSFLGSDPFLTFLSKDNQIEIRRPNGTERIQGNPFRYLKRLFSRYRIVRPFGLPPLLGGAVGYFAYDLCQFVERLPSAARDDVPIPDCYLGFYDVLLAIDHQEDRAYLCSSGLPETDERKAQERAKARLDQFREKLLGGKGGSGTGGTATFPDLLSRPSENSSTHLTSNFTREDYLEAVRRAKEYIAAGDIYQVNLSQRLAVPIPEHPFQLYRRLREINPAPFSAYLNLGMDDITIVSSSPERFLKVEGDLVETRPIKGTRPRGQTPQEDERLAQELINSEKDRAENVMIVDLERNDLGKVCRYGSVRVRELFGLEKYATWFLPWKVGCIAAKPCSICCAPVSPAAPSPAPPKSGPWKS